MRHIPLLLFILLPLFSFKAHAAPCATSDPFVYTPPARIGSEKVDPTIDCPSDIQNWMNRVNACAHFSGEPPYDEERRKFIDDQLAKNKCDAIKCDYKKLKSEYEGDIVYFGIVIDFMEAVYGEETMMPECNPQSQPKSHPDEHSCLLIRDLESGKTLKEEGECQTRTSPMSTFKIPLALMGYDAGILKDEHHPAWPFKEGYQVNKDNDRLTTDPTTWEANSVVWYSQKITQDLGIKKFQDYVTSFSYGNMDLSGNKGKNNGLTRAWLISSLEISPQEQTDFLRHMLNQEFQLSAQAYKTTFAIIPKFDAAHGWKVSGKTGSGWLRTPNGTPDHNHPLGWFVGWAEKGDRKVVFAKRIIGDEESDKPMGPTARDEFLADLGE